MSKVNPQERIKITLEKIQTREAAIAKMKAKPNQTESVIHWTKFMEGQVAKLKEKVGHLSNYSIKL